MVYRDTLSKVPGNDFKEIISTINSELLSAQSFLEKLNNSLHYCHSGTNLSDEIGIYTKQLPEFIYLKDFRQKTLTIIRQVCTKELDKSDAECAFATELDNIKETLNCIKL